MEDPLTGDVPSRSRLDEEEEAAAEALHQRSTFTLAIEDATARRPRCRLAHAALCAQRTGPALTLTGSSPGPKGASLRQRHAPPPSPSPTLSPPDPSAAAAASFARARL